MTQKTSLDRGGRGGFEIKLFISLLVKVFRRVIFLIVSSMIVVQH